MPRCGHVDGVFDHGYELTGANLLYACRLSRSNGALLAKMADALFLNYY